MYYIYICYIYIYTYVVYCISIFVSQEFPFDPHCPSSLSSSSSARGTLGSGSRAGAHENLEMTEDTGCYGMTKGPGQNYTCSCSMVFILKKYGVLWISMDNYGLLWIIMDNYGWFWIIMDDHGWFWIIMDSRFITATIRLSDRWAAPKILEDRLLQICRNGCCNWLVLLWRCPSSKIHMCTIEQPWAPWAGQDIN